MSFDPLAFFDRLNHHERKLIAAAAGGCADFAEMVLAESQKLCPVSPTDPKHPLYTGHSGALRDSGTVKDPVVEAGKITVEIGYNTDYAAAVHERLDLNHQYPGARNADAQAKYLETPIRANQARFGPFISNVIKEALGG